MKISNSKNYNNLRFYLKRVHKIENSGSLSHFLIEKFSSLSDPCAYVKIFKNELIIAGILKENDKLYEWREEMGKKQILVCKADMDAKKAEEANYLCAEFKYGQNVKKYIEISSLEKRSIIQRLSSKVEVEQLQILTAQLNEDRMQERLEAQKNKVRLEDVELRVLDLEDNFISVILHFMPPDNETRRAIVKKFGLDREICFDELNKQASQERILKAV